MRTLLCAVAVFAAACGAPARPPVAEGSWLYVFAGDADNAPPGGMATPMKPHLGGDRDFLAVIDADTASPTYAKVVATAPIAGSGTMPHHTESEMPRGGRALLANAYMEGRTYLFDFTDPLKPQVAGTVDSVPGYRKPHSFYRLADGNVVATLLFGDGKLAGDPGGLALFSPEGRLLRVGSAADSAFPGASLRIYSLDVSPATDRVLTTSSPMELEPGTADVVQLWRLSDLKLLKTVALPKTAPDSTSRYPFEIRFLPDGRSAILNTYYCGVYYLSGFDAEAPKVEPVLALEQPANLYCAVPLLVGTWWILPIEHRREIVVYDLSAPRQPREVGVLAGDSTFAPHWLSREPGTDRIVVTAEYPSPAVRLARFDSTTGSLTWDESFRDRPDGPPGVSFDRPAWTPANANSVLGDGRQVLEPPFTWRGGAPVRATRRRQVADRARRT
ncbi:MAG: hypothetical protein FJ206_11380, partial [Gemmatimonadetes bacterium]|nr:hypothetical protein [Gemmatimonadota bacterium]